MPKKHTFNRTKDTVLPMIFKAWPEFSAQRWEHHNPDTQEAFTHEVFLKEIGLGKPGTTPPETYITPKEYGSLMKGTAIPDREAAEALAALADHQGLATSEVFMKLYEKLEKALPKEEDEYARKRMNTNHPRSDLTVLEFPEGAVEQIRQLVPPKKVQEKNEEDEIAVEGRPSTSPTQSMKR